MIEDRHYEEKLVTPTLNYAYNLESVWFENRKTFHIDFIKLFLTVKQDKKLCFYVPKDVKDRFEISMAYKYQDCCKGKPRKD